MYKYKKVKLKDGTTRDEHRIIMEEYLGRQLRKVELVHHINGDPQDNQIENLEIVDIREHPKIHKDDLFPVGEWAKQNLRKATLDTGFCHYCKQHKPAEEMIKDKHHWNGLDSECKACKKERNKKYRMRM